MDGGAAVRMALAVTVSLMVGFAWAVPVPTNQAADLAAATPSFACRYSYTASVTLAHHGIKDSEHRVITHSGEVRIAAADSANVSRLLRCGVPTFPYSSDSPTSRTHDANLVRRLLA